MAGAHRPRARSGLWGFEDEDEEDAVAPATQAFAPALQPPQRHDDDALARSRHGAASHQLQAVREGAVHAPLGVGALGRGGAPRDPRRAEPAHSGGGSTGWGGSPPQHLPAQPVWAAPPTAAAPGTARASLLAARLAPAGRQHAHAQHHHQHHHQLQHQLQLLHGHQAQQHVALPAQLQWPPLSPLGDLDMAPAAPDAPAPGARPAAHFEPQQQQHDVPWQPPLARAAAANAALPPTRARAQPRDAHVQQGAHHPPHAGPMAPPPPLHAAANAAHAPSPPPLAALAAQPPALPPQLLADAADAATPAQPAVPELLPLTALAPLPPLPPLPPAPPQAVAKAGRAPKRPRGAKPAAPSAGGGGGGGGAAVGARAGGRQRAQLANLPVDQPDAEAGGLGARQVEERLMALLSLAEATWSDAAIPQRGAAALRVVKVRLQAGKDGSWEWTVRTSLVGTCTCWPSLPQQTAFP